MEIRALREGNTVQYVDSKEETKITVESLAIISMYIDKGTGCPYEYREITDEWLLGKGFEQLPKDEKIFAYKRHFFIAKTNSGYEYVPNIAEYRSYGTPKRYCHEIENLFHDLFDNEDCIDLINKYVEKRPSN